MSLQKRSVALRMSPECSQGSTGVAELRAGLPAGEEQRKYCDQYSTQGSHPGDQGPPKWGSGGEYWRMTVGAGEEQAGGWEGEGALQTWHHLPGVSHRPNSPGHGGSATWPSGGSHRTPCALWSQDGTGEINPAQNLSWLRNHSHYSPASATQPQPGHPIVSPKGQSIGCVFAQSSAGGQCITTHSCTPGQLSSGFSPL